ncbi:MAG TPA: 4'-phosphopantetheinyl transferase superfamily protein [Gammaproteobacteria bacterium]|nr:4'-phosphopantetheinyl transferase superfamily protein [Gammaproteobacteria bacterium]
MPHALLLPRSFQLAPDEVHVWRVVLDVTSETSALLYATLARDERDRAARFRFEHDRRRFIAAHGALRDLVARYLDARPGRIAYVYNDFGKPALGPEFDGRLKFNLSHSNGFALVAITAGSEVGVDLEHVRAPTDFAAIARGFFSAAEAEHLAALPSHLCAEAFLGCWTKKEAYLKASGEGLATPLNGFSVPMATDYVDTPVDLYAASNANGPAKRWSLYTLKPTPGYIGAVAIEGTGWRLQQRPWAPPSDANALRADGTLLDDRRGHDHRGLHGQRVEIGAAVGP